MATRLLVYPSEAAAQTAADAMHTEMQRADKSYNADAWDVPREHESTGKWAIIWDDARLKAFAHGAESTRTLNQARNENWFPEPEEPEPVPLEKKGKVPTEKAGNLEWKDGPVTVTVQGNDAAAKQAWNDFLGSQ